MDARERFLKRAEMSMARRQQREKDLEPSAIPDQGVIPHHNLPALPIPTYDWNDDGGDRQSNQAEADALLAEIQGNLNDEKISSLIEACQRECLQAVIRPFGIGRVLFQDQIGGNVLTVHNVRNEEFQTKSNLYTKSGEKSAYDNRGECNGTDYYADKSYIAANRKTSEEQDAGGLLDYITGKNIGANDKKDLDHVVAKQSIHDDPGRVLAGLTGPELANREANLRATDRTVNRSKQDKNAKEYVSYLRETKIPNLEAKIAKLETSGPLSLEQSTFLEKEKKKLERLKAVSAEKLEAAEKEAKSDIDKTINKTYYTSKKFLNNTAITSVTEGGKMAIQQAVGVLMEEFVRAAFAEVKDIWQNGFKGKVDDTFLSALKVRLMRVAQRVHQQWEAAVAALQDGFVSGFLSNILTVIINAFMTTAAKWVRIIREGFMSLYRAMKMLACPPEGMTGAEAAHEALKLLAAGVVTGAGILLEEAIRLALDGVTVGILTPVIPYITGVGVGLVTGLSTAFSVYMIDHLDLFGVQEKLRHDHVVGKLNQMIDVSYESALEAAAVFDGPVLLHLT